MLPLAASPGNQMAQSSAFATAGTLVRAVSQSGESEKRPLNRLDSVVWHWAAAMAHCIAAGRSLILRSSKSAAAFVRLCRRGLVFAFTYRINRGDHSSMSGLSRATGMHCIDVSLRWFRYWPACDQPTAADARGGGE